MDRKLGPYQLGASLATLPLGELVAATHSARSEPLAVLLLDERLTKETRFRALLRLEVARVGGVRQPALARPIEVGEQGGELYVVVERPAESVSLAARLRDGHPPSEEQALALVRSLAAGLDAAHGRRLVHGALGPESVLIGTDGGAVLVGLGLLGAVEEAGQAAVVAASDSTAALAPEQHGGKLAVASADGYALAALAAALVPGLPADARAVLDRQRADAPAERYPTCSAFAAALTDAATPAAADASSATPGPSTPAPTHATSPPAPATFPSVPEPPSAAPLPRPSPTAPTGPPALPITAPEQPAPPITAPWSLPATSMPPVIVSPPDAAAPSLPWEPTDPVPPVRPPVAFDGGPIPGSAWREGPFPGLRDVLDPPGSAGLAPARPEPIPPFAPPPERVTVTTSAPTPAMLACLERLEQRDPIGDGVLWLAGRVPALDRLLDRVSTDGKVGRVPLGVAVAGLLALLFLLVQQVVAGVLILLLVGVLYVVPQAVQKLTGSERVRLEVTHVRGPIRVRKSAPSVLGTLPQLELPNGLTLTVSQVAMDRVTRLGAPIAVERPVPGTHGTRPEVVAHEVAEVIVTYLTSSRFLFDIRDATGTVVYRNPRYQGEPVDALQPSPWGITQGDEPSAERVGPTETADQWGRATMLPIPLSLRTSLRTAASKAATQTTLCILVPLLVVLGLFLAGSQAASLAFILGSIAFMLFGSGPLARALALRHVRHTESIARVDGPSTLRQVRRGKSYRYRIQLADGVEIEIDSRLHTRLAQEGTLTLKSDSFVNFGGQFGHESVVAEHRLPVMTVTYVPGGLILLIVNPLGAQVYVDPAVNPDDLAEATPRV
jgi:serine/threonine protein kinase